MENANSRIYRITGPQSVDRIRPLLQTLGYGVHWVEATEESSHLDFVWETACEKHWNDRHMNATVLNRLHNSTVIEDKSNLAFLQLRMNVPVLETCLAQDMEAAVDWMRRKWSQNGEAEVAAANMDSCPTSDWWAVKCSKGNGGKDVWMVNRENYESVAALLPRNEEFVIQKYVDKPLLWRGKKFHFRCYGVLHADGCARLYQYAYILSASMDFDVQTDVNSCKHITNLSVNKHAPGHPGQVPCDLLAEYPELFKKIGAIWGAVAEASWPFMEVQRSSLHFDFFGVDVIADTEGNCWLIEANRLPGLESSLNNLQEEDIFYNEMMAALLKIVLDPLQGSSTASSRCVDPMGHCNRFKVVWRNSEESLPSPPKIGSTPALAPSPPRNCSTSSDAPPLWKNIFNWKAFTKKNRGRILV